jgi:glycosyltransferase involved in cell wall biosynthesis
MSIKKNKKILFFIGSLISGGKQRRLIELLTYLEKKTGYELLIVIAYNQIDYPAFYRLESKHIILNKKPDFKDPRLFYRMYKICKSFKPDIIHTWGSMQTFYMIPSAIINRIPLINSQITSAKPNNRFDFVNALNFHFSKYITSNSVAGLESYGLKQNDKYRVIYNGINLDRFKNLPTADQIKKEMQIETKYSVVMVASFTENKNYDKYLDICEYVNKIRSDITFIAVGDGYKLEEIKSKARRLIIRNLKFTGRINNVEEVVQACDVGILLSNEKVHGEGVSNSIMEYMALSKPVIANDAGGTREILRHNENGILISNENPQEIAVMLMELIDNPQLCASLGQTGRKIIEQEFSLKNMGETFECLYRERTH